MQAVGFIGLGSMGLPMARNLVTRGFAVTGYDLRPQACAALAAAGGRVADTAAGACAGADAVVLMVVNIDQARAVLFSGAVLDALSPGASILLMSTCPPGAVANLADEVNARGFALVDCPVSGGVVGAEAASLTLMVGASDADLARVRPLLDAMGARVVHVGPKPGQGATAKVVNQLLCGAHLALAAEALSLAERLGVDTAVMLDILSGSAASSWMLKDRGPRMLEPDPAVTSAVDIFVKDLGLVLDAGREARVGLPLAALAHQLFLSVSGRGFGAADDSQIVRAYRWSRPDIP